MAILPNELLSEICSHADIATLKQLRLTDRSFNVMSSKFLFEEIEFILLPESIEKAQKIMGHSTLRHLVTTLRYFGSRLNSSLGIFEKWKSYALHVFTDGLSPDSLASWEKFCRFLSEQSILAQDGTESDIFGVACSQLPNLTTVELRGEDWEEFEYRQRSPYHSVARQCLLTVHYAFKSGSTSIDLSWSPHMSLIKSLADITNKVVKLHLEDVPWSSHADITNRIFYLNARPYIAPRLGCLLSLTLDFWVHGISLYVIPGAFH